VRETVIICEGDVHTPRTRTFIHLPQYIDTKLDSEIMHDDTKLDEALSELARLPGGLEEHGLDYAQVSTNVCWY
jgi:hypothetical protein